MARRIYGDLNVRPRPNGGAVITLKSATGEAIEIERDADQVAALLTELAAIEPPITPQEEVGAVAQPKAKRSKKHA